MLKNIFKGMFLISSGVVLSFVVLVIGTQIVLYISTARLSVSPVAEGQEASFALVADPIPTSSLILFLVVALCVGGFIGYLANRLALLAAAMSLGPFLWFLNAASGWKLEALYLSIAYLLIATGTAFVVARWRSKPSAPNGT